MQSTDAHGADGLENVSEEIRLKLVKVIEQWLNENPALYKINWEDVSQKIASAGVFLLPIDCCRIWRMAAGTCGNNEDDDSDLDKDVVINGHYLSKIEPKIQVSMPNTWNQLDCIHLPHVVDDAVDPSFETIQSFHNRHFDDSVRFYLIPALNRKSKKVKSIIDAGPSAPSFPQPDNKKPRLDPSTGMHNFHPTLAKDSKSAFAEKVIGQQIQQLHGNNSSSSNSYQQQQQLQNNLYAPLLNKPTVYTPAPAPRFNMPITQQQLQSQFPYRPSPYLGLPQQHVGLTTTGSSSSSQANISRAPLLPAFQTLSSTSTNNGKGNAL